MSQYKPWSVLAWGSTAVSWANAAVAAVQDTVPNAPITSNQAVNFALWATGISAVGAAITGSVVGLYRGIRNAQIEVAKAWMATDPGKFQAQITALKEVADHAAKRTEDANRKLHDLADEANVRELLHQEEVKRLQDQLKLALDQLRSATEELHRARDENRELMARMTRQIQQGQQVIVDEIHAQAEGGQS